MDKIEKAALFSVVGSGFAVTGGLWLLGSILAGGEAWQGSAISLMIAYTAKSYAYAMLREPKAEKLDLRTLHDF